MSCVQGQDLLPYHLWIYHFVSASGEVVCVARSSGFERGELTDTAVSVLLALVKPRHGYAVMQFLGEQSDGAIALGPASLYTTLKKLTAARLIDELEADDTRRIYRLNREGHEALARNIERRRGLLAMADRILEDA